MNIPGRVACFKYLGNNNEKLPKIAVMRSEFGKLALEGIMNDQFKSVYQISTPDL